MGAIARGGIALASVTNVTTLTASGKVYVKWTDPEDIVVEGAPLATWGGTILVRKAGSAPTSRRDGTIVLDSKTRNQYQSTYFCDGSLTDGTEYFYKLFPYTISNTYTDSPGGAFSATPAAVAPGNVSGKSAVASGNGKLTIKWTDPAETVVEDGITLATWASTKVVYKTGSYPQNPQDGTVAINNITRNAYSTTGFEISGLTNGTTYYISIFPISTDGAVNVNSVNRISGVPNRIIIDNLPSQSGNLTYNGNTLTPVWSNYSSEQLSIGGTTSGINAGNYNATFAPKDDYMWPDGSTDAKTVSWGISKAAGSLSRNPASVTLSTSALTASVTVTRLGNGTVTAISSDTGVATATVSNPTGTNPVVTISHVGQTTGTAAITIRAAAGDNHTAPADVSVSVTAQFMPAKKALNDMTWAEIKQVSDADMGSNYWDVGDRKAVTVKGTIGTLSVNQTLYVFILGFNHNSAKEGKGIQFGTFKSALSGGVGVCLVDAAYNTNNSSGAKNFNLNHWGSSSSPYNTNYGGWKGCDARYDILGSTNKAPSGYGSMATTSRVGYDAEATTATNPVANTLMAALPADLRAVMKPITKYTDNKGNNSNVAANVTTSVDYLPLLSEFEIFGTRSYANQYEQNSQLQYDYYKAGNSKVKYRHDNNGTAAYWWERSPYCDSASGFCLVYTDGYAYGSDSRSSAGLAPAFMV